MAESIAFLVSCFYVFAVMALAGLLRKRGLVGPETARKIVHIGAAHWWFFLIAFFRSPLVMLAGPLCFLLLNLASYRFRLFRVLEEAARPGRFGTLYFPLSLALLAILVAHGLLSAWVAGIGVLIMGWGDGLAAVLGSRLGAKAAEPSAAVGAKSAVGSLTMFLASFCVVVLMTLGFEPSVASGEVLLRALATALCASLVERATPWGMDNLSVPVLSALFYRFGATSGGVAALFVVAAAGSVLASAMAWKMEALSREGAVAASCVGTAVITLGGFGAFALLMTFFVSATAVGRVARSRVPPSGIEAKGGRRDALQVLANSWAAVLALTLWRLTLWPGFLVGLGAALAAANADTWASELGLLSPVAPRHILTGKPLPAGSSGGVSRLGYAASAAGSLLVSAVFWLCPGVPGDSRSGHGAAGVIVLVAGFAGSVIDSVIGGTLQAQYRSRRTGLVTERPAESREANPLVRGWRIVTNDTVNALSTLAAGALAVIASALI
ncbi:MAG TPA: DUF92 domain-containing protein [Rectinemataceae bacterium]|nr:DUF92 domain-containing protein [Rectinemataceae bacterium]